MMLYFPDGRSFVTGATPYLDQHPVDYNTPRIVVKIWVGQIQIETVVDTGGVYFICDPEILNLGDFDLGDSLGVQMLKIRGYDIMGDLYRIMITLVAEQGKNLDLEVTAFVPHFVPERRWPFPSFLGLQGCLEFLRFAVDPMANTFYFGALAD